MPLAVQQAEIDGQVLVLLHQHVHGAAGVAGDLARLLQLGQGDDGLVEALDDRLEAVQGGVEGAAERRGDDKLDGVWVWEGGAQRAALVDAEGGQLWVGDVVVARPGVMYALAVANEVDCRWHLFAIFLGGFLFI